MPIFYECQRCTACCRWPGQVRLTEAEIARLADFLGLGEHEFIQSHTRLTQDRRGLALQENSNGACVFLAGDNCAVQSVKPQQCRDFPNLWRHPGAESECQAIPRTLGDDEYLQRVGQVTGRSVVAVREILQRRKRRQAWLKLKTADGRG